ncbi:MAG: glycosyltransferase family 4 protein [bacterium]|nr:glycosyltransferase family 4 protein [bacterium]
MIIATNVQRDAFGGVTISNLALFDWLEGTTDTIVGIEFVTARHILGPVIFRRYAPTFFRHHIVNGIDIIPRYSWERFRNPRKHWHVLVEATKDALRQEHPDVVLINGTYFAPWILGRAAHELGIPIVLRYAGVLQREVAHKNFLIRKRLMRHEQWIASIADAIIFPSTLCREVVEREVLGRVVLNGTVIPNPATVLARYRQKRNERYTVAAVGRWTPVKNFQAFIALHRTLLDRRWPHRAIMVTSYWDEQFGIPETMERREPMSQEDLGRFYRSIDLLVVPSHFETFCNVAAEAIVHGTSVLVSEQVGCAEILRAAGLERMVIPTFDDPERVVTAVKRLAATRLTTKERHAVAALLDSHGVHQRIVQVLKGVLRTA